MTGVLWSLEELITYPGLTCAGQQENMGRAAPQEGKGGPTRPYSPAGIRTRSDHPLLYEIFLYFYIYKKIKLLFDIITSTQIF